MKNLSIRKESGIELRPTKNGNLCLFYDGQWTSKRIADYLLKSLEKEKLSYVSLSEIVKDSLNLIKNHYSDELADDGVSYKESAINDFYDLIAEIVAHFFYDDDADELWNWLNENPNLVVENKELFQKAKEDIEDAFPFSDGNNDLLAIFS